MGKAYDELNLTASDYNIKVDIQSRHRHEFDVMFRHELQNDNNSRGLLFKRYLEQKLKVQRVNFSRIDLVFDCKKMIDLLEARGEAIKMQDYTAL